jgi:hypothetical protein
MQLSGTPTKWNAGLRSSVLCAGALVVCGVAFGTGIGSQSLSEIVGSSGVLFIIVLCSLIFWGRRGLGFLWLLVVGFWIALVFSEFDNAGWVLTSTVRMLPDVFVSWSIIALSLSAGTVDYLRNQSGKSSLPILEISGCALWLLLFVVSVYLARHAPDVGNNPRDQPVFWGICLLTIPFALLASLSFTWKLLRTPL